MRILYELVTVFREQEPLYHWETGKMADVMIYEPGDLPAVVQEQLFQPTSNWEYMPRDRIKITVLIPFYPFFGEKGFIFVRFL